MHQEPPRPRTRREVRALTDLSDGASTQRGGENRPRSRRRLRSWLAVGVVLLVLLAGAAVAAIQLYDRVLTTRTHLEAAMGEVQIVKKSIAALDTVAAKEAAARLSLQTSAAVQPTQGRLWALAEYVPLVGPNLAAVRQVAEVTDALVAEAVLPATQLDLSALAPSAGRIDVVALGQQSEVVESVVTAVDKASATIDKIDKFYLIDKVSAGVVRLEGALATIDETLAPVRDILSVLPEALGTAGARDYLVMFQGNSEARSLGGNAAVFIVIHVDNGSISITDHVNSSDFRQPADAPVVSLDAEAVAIYGDKIGRYTPDFTMVPDFPTASGILQGWWDRAGKTDVDAYISMDPVALSYLLAVTGPVALPTGETLTAVNASPLLLNEVYFRYQDPLIQNAFFGAAADAVFTALADGSGPPTGLITALARAADEGRMLYASTDPDETALIAQSRLSGRMPAAAEGDPTLGVYVNDNTASKKSYYLDMSIDACAAEGEAHASVTLSSALDESEAGRLPYYIAGPYYPLGDISSYLVLYGPVGSTFVSVEIDGHAVLPLAVGQHLGRPAVKVEVLNRYASAHVIDVSFAEVPVGGGDLEVWHTPMTRETPVEVVPCVG